MTASPSTEFFRVEPLPRTACEAAVDLLFASYAADPEFAALFGLAPEQVGVVRHLFDDLVASIDRSRVPGLLLGCYQGERLVGVVGYVPHARWPNWRLWAHAPMMMARESLFRLACRWRDLRLPRIARRRWREYGRLALKLQPRTPTLQVLALGVLPTMQRAGVAARLLDSVSGDPRWTAFAHVEVETWHARNAAIYRRLGFVEAAHDQTDTAGPLRCWVLLKPITRPPVEAAKTQSAATPP